MDRNAEFLKFTSGLLRPRQPQSTVVIFKTADDFLRAAGLADPDPAFTKLYQSAHAENRLRDADVAWENVKKLVTRG